MLEHYFYGSSCIEYIGFSNIGLLISESPTRKPVHESMQLYLAVWGVRRISLCKCLTIVFGIAHSTIVLDCKYLKSLEQTGRFATATQCYSDR